MNEKSPDFIKSGDAPAQGARDIGLCFIGGSLVNGYGDPKALGWVARVLARTPRTSAHLTAYNLGVRGASTAAMLASWRDETDPRFRGRNEHRLVIGLGAADIRSGLSTARSRLNLANILDDASTSGVGTFVVGPPPTLDEHINHQLMVFADAAQDVCSRRGVTYVDCFRPLATHEQWVSDLTAGDGVHPGQAGYGLIAWLVLHAGWASWLSLDA